MMYGDDPSCVDGFGDGVGVRMPKENWKNEVGLSEGLIFSVMKGRYGTPSMARVSGLRWCCRCSSAEEGDVRALLLLFPGAI